MTRLRHVWLALTVLTATLFNARRRALFREMRAFIHHLPVVLKAPLPQALQQITPPAGGVSESEQNVRQLADVIALLDRRSPLGLCLRRSLTRYYFLHRADVPVIVHFGAKFVGGRPDRDITGHAWLTLAGEPYYESGENWRGFTVMLSYPPSDGKIPT